MAICIHYDKADHFHSIYDWDSSHEHCNVGDVLLKGPEDLEYHYSPKEIIQVLRVIEPKASNWFFHNVIMVPQRTKQASAYGQSVGWVWDHLVAHTLPFNDYTLKEITTMNAPVKPAKEKAPKKEKEPKAPTKSALEKWAEKNGFTMDSKIGFGANKEGEAYSKENCPKRGASADRWKATYKEGMTLTEYAAAGGRKDDLDWDTSATRGWIKVSK